MIKFDSFIRNDAMLNTRFRHVIKNEKHALEEKNTIVIPHKRTSFTQKFKKFFKSNYTEE